jgi:HlyD family secretion protein
MTRRSQLRAEQAPQTVAVTRGSITLEALAIGSITPKQEVSVKSKIPGIVDAVHVAIGDPVRAGEPLIEIRPDPTPIERAEAQRRLEIARVTEEGSRKDLERAEGLAQRGLLSDQELEAAQNSHESAHLQAQLENERLQLLEQGHARLKDTEVSNRIVSPVAGTILTCDVHPGDPVVPLTSYQEGTVLLTLADMSELLFRGTVDEIDVGKLEVGQPIRFVVGAIPDEDVHGVLSRISPKARKEDSATLFDVEARITECGSRPLRAGYSANAKIAIAEAADVLVLPERVVRYQDGAASVRIPAEGEEAECRTIKTGLSDGLMVEVTEGLTEGDLVLEPDKSPIER